MKKYSSKRWKAAMSKPSNRILQETPGALKVREIIEAKVAEILPEIQGGSLPVGGDSDNSKKTSPKETVAWLPYQYDWDPLKHDYLAGFKIPQHLKESEKLALDRTPQGEKPFFDAVAAYYSGLNRGNTVPNENIDVWAEENFEQVLDAVSAATKVASLVSNEGNTESVAKYWTLGTAKMYFDCFREFSEMTIGATPDWGAWQVGVLESPELADLAVELHRSQEHAVTCKSCAKRLRELRKRNAARRH